MIICLNYFIVLNELQIVTEHSLIFKGCSFASIHADHIKITEFGSQNGVPEQAYIDRMEFVRMMIDHSKSFQLEATAFDLSFGRNVSLRLLKEGAPVQDHPSLISVTPLVTWRAGATQPSQHFASFGWNSRYLTSRWLSNLLTPVTSFKAEDG